MLAEEGGMVGGGGRVENRLDGEVADASVDGGGTVELSPE